MSDQPQSSLRSHHRSRLESDDNKTGVVGTHHASLMSTPPSEDAHPMQLLRNLFQVLETEYASRHLSLVDLKADFLQVLAERREAIHHRSSRSRARHSHRVHARKRAPLQHQSSSLSYEAGNSSDGSSDGSSSDTPRRKQPKITRPSRHRPRTSSPHYDSKSDGDDGDDGTIANASYNGAESASENGSEDIDEVPTESSLPLSSIVSASPSSPTTRRMAKKHKHRRRLASLMRINMLPEEILVHIFSFLSHDIPSLVNATSVCKKWHEAAMRRSVWVSACVTKFRLPPPVSDSVSSKLHQLVSQRDYAVSLEDIVPLVLAGAKLRQIAGPFGATTILLLAAYHGHNELVKFLIVRGFSSSDEVNSRGVNVLMVAAFRNNQELYSWLTKRNLPTTVCDVDQNNSLMLACIYNAQKVISYIVDQNDDQLTMRNRYGYQAHHHAAMGGHPAGVAKLISAGLDVNALSNEGYSPMLLAALYGHESVFSLLARNPTVDMLARDKWGGTSVMLAAMGSRRSSDTAHMRIILYVLQSASIALSFDDVDNFGRTALHYAVPNDYPEAVTLLEGLGIDRSVRDNFGATAQDYKDLLTALRGGDTDAADAILSSLTGVVITCAFCSFDIEITTKDFTNLLQRLEHNTTVRSVILIGSSISTADCTDVLLRVLESNHVLAEIDLGDAPKQHVPPSVKRLLQRNKALALQAEGNNDADLS